MYLTSEIVNDTLAARRFRLLAPLAVLLALVALALAPGIIGIMIAAKISGSIMDAPPLRGTTGPAEGRIVIVSDDTSANITPCS